MFADQAGWGTSVVASTGDVVKDAMKKEKVIRDILAFQDDLRVLLDRVKMVEKEADKLSSGNATLQMYIDNLTLQMAKRR
ncbi:hypothetical protein F5148DRAFT_1189337 [Russula earlei]|uniref:Uncharacterized protein n=1 Tax=Russula earlei TaxID=71964 RepID=A0ACC0UCI4_9AGAM|nr:hypothetical protein F5148DRAFT_1189337 [Russula earlei]